MALSAFRSFIDDLAPKGASWQGPAYDRLLTGTVSAFDEFVDHVCTLQLKIAPFTAARPVLLQWLDYLRVVECVATPVDTEDLRARVLSLLGAESSAFIVGLERRILAYLPLVEVETLLPLSTLPFPLNSPLDPHEALVEVWFSAFEDSPDIIQCVAQAFTPASAIIRPVQPILTFSNPTGGDEAGNMALQWDEMRGSDLPSTTDLFVELKDGVTTEDSATIAIDPKDSALASDLLPLFGPTDNVGGFDLFATVTRTWASGSRTIFTGSSQFP